jgi:hypothetical protein
MWWSWVLFWTGVLTSFQPVPIMLETVFFLQPIDELTFTEEFQQGWFVLNDTGSAAVVLDREGGVWRYDVGGELRLLYTEEPLSLAAGLFTGETFHGLHNIGETIRIYRVADEVVVLDIPSDAPALDLWTLDDGSYTIERLSAPMLVVDPFGELMYEETLLLNDPENVVRIGRIPSPYEVTSTEEGLVTLWFWPLNQPIVTVDNGTGIPSVFGNINNAASHLVWRDNFDTTLYLLDFLTGENRVIAPLNGEYVQWFFLSPNADVILGVNVNFVPNVFVWDVATGERFDLGPYLTCARPQPDRARLSTDGTTLVIGCDAGLQFWRVVIDALG